MKPIHKETKREKIVRWTRYVRQMRKNHPEYSKRKTAQDAIEDLVLDLLES